MDAMRLDHEPPRFAYPCPSGRVHEGYLDPWFPMHPGPTDRQINQPTPRREYGHEGAARPLGARLWPPLGSAAKEDHQSHDNLIHREAGPVRNQDPRRSLPG